MKQVSLAHTFEHAVPHHTLSTMPKHRFSHEKMVGTTYQLLDKPSSSLRAAS